MTWSTPPRPSRAALADLPAPTGRSSTASSSTADGSIKTVNPATEEVLAEVTAASDDVDRAVAAARRAYDTCWCPMPGAERAKYLFRIARHRRRAGPRAGRAGDAGQRQADPRVARRRRAHGAQRTCSTTRAGPTSWSTQGSGRPRSRSAWSAR